MVMVLVVAGMAMVVERGIEVMEKLVLASKGAEGWNGINLQGVHAIQICWSVHIGYGISFLHAWMYEHLCQFRG